MKKLNYLFVVLVVSLFCSNLAAQTSTAVVKAPSDATQGYVYDFDLAHNLIMERQQQPDVSNEDVKPIIEAAGFPKITDANNVDKKYTEKLSAWMEKNSNIIISTLKNRKDIVHTFESK